MIPETSRAAILPSPGAEPIVQRYPVPSMEPGAILLKTLASEVCGTDVHLWHGRLAGVPYPLIPGHVSIGIVETVMGEVLDVNETPIRVGDMVTFLDVHGTCNRCWYCLVAKATTRCPHRRVYGITMGANDVPGLTGGWSERIYLRPGTKIIRLAPGVSPDAWIGGGCGLPTAVHAIELARIRPGRSRTDSRQRPCRSQRLRPRAAQWRELGRRNRCSRRPPGSRPQNRRGLDLRH